MPGRESSATTCEKGVAMYSFASDYLEGCHPAILKKLSEINLSQTPGYGLDPFCEQAAAAIRETFSCPEADVHFLVGGTQANTVVISSVLRPYEGVLCASSGHINVHETGAIEATGHKVLSLPSRDGRITSAQISAAVALQSACPFSAARSVSIAYSGFAL